MGRPGASVKETEILTGVLEATVRDPSGRAPAPSSCAGSCGPRKHRRRRATRPHFHAREASPEADRAGIKTAARVAKLVFDAGLAGVKRPTDEEAFIRQHVYTPEYRQFA